MASPADRRTLAQSVAAEFGTPCYLLEWMPIADRLSVMDRELSGLQVHHLYSYKTCPVPAVMRSWLATGRGVEVVSDFELRGAMALGFAPQSIVVNGVAKHCWLSRNPVDGLAVNFDSLLEVTSLAETAARHRWRVGLRLHPPGQRDPDDDRFPDQFGMDLDSARKAIRHLTSRDLPVHIVHVHLRSNLSRGRFSQGLRDVADMCIQLGINPRVLDCGGGLPCAGILPHGYADGDPLTIEALGAELQSVLTKFKTPPDIWLENGRHVLADAGTLLVRVRDSKAHDGIRLLVCDGGRTNHALVSDWEPHRLSVIPERHGSQALTVVCGPTCMAYDWLYRGQMPDDIMIDDLLLWHDAGAYHIPWETRFSHGVAPIVYVDERGRCRAVRAREDFETHWRQWTH